MKQKKMGKLIVNCEDGIDFEIAHGYKNASFQRMVAEEEEQNKKWLEIQSLQASRYKPMKKRIRRKWRKKRSIGLFRYVVVLAA